VAVELRSAEDIKYKEIIGELPKLKNMTSSVELHKE